MRAVSHRYEMPLLNGVGGKVVMIPQCYTRYFAQAIQYQYKETILDNHNRKVIGTQNRIILFSFLINKLYAVLVQKKSLQKYQHIFSNVNICAALGEICLCILTFVVGTVHVSHPEPLITPLIQCLYCLEQTVMVYFNISAYCGP